MDPILATILGSFAGLLLLEAVVPGRRFPRVRAWRLRGALSLVVYIAVASTLPLVTDAFLGAHRLIDASGLGVAGGTLVGVLVLELAIYAWHRALHRSPFLWRWFHQVHHSAERIDTAGAFYFSPLDMLGFTLLGSVTLVWAVGVAPEAAVYANLIATLFNLFQHANIRTPAWLGYVVQRPENHAVHHQRGVHGWNYGDIALWDIVFGTWRNPARFDAEGGFFDGSTDRLGAMLIGRDIAAEHEARTPAPGETAVVLRVAA
jgi:sterol desaturase/sphingolipid hydroxylase (fatty acid hydroxylase superfamily)